MTEDQLYLIESRLKIRLPESYRALHHDHTDHLRKLDWSDAAINPFYLAAEHVIAPNIEERSPEMGTACAFPYWWETFVLVGTNGGGDYYALRLDNTEGVWLIGSDCGETPTRVADTLQQYVEQAIAEHEAAKALEAERVRRRASFQREIEAHLVMIAQDLDSLELVPPKWAGAGSPMAAAWITCDAIWPMFEWLRERKPKVSSRKLRLYGLALCRLIPDLEDDADCAAAITLAKAMTIGMVSELDVSQMRSRLRRKIEHLESNYESFVPEKYRATLWRIKAVHDLFQTEDAYLSDTVFPGDPDLTRVYGAVGYATTGREYGVELAPELLREVLGNPFHQIPVAPEWRTPEVVNLAQTIFEQDAFQRLSELATALEYAGCTDERILAHLHRPEHHVRGCWVVDKFLEN